MSLMNSHTPIQAPRSNTENTGPAAIEAWMVRVYWEDTDAGGIVFYANYLKYFERARTEWLRHKGISQQRLRQDTGCIFIVAETAVRYLAPARLDDLLRITTEVENVSRASMTLRQRAWRDDLLLADGTVRIASVNAQTLRPVRMPSLG